MESQGAATLIRDYEPRDFARIKEIHEASGLDYQLPDLSSPLFIVRKVIELDGKIIAAGFLRIETEAYLLLAKNGTDAQEKFSAIQAVQSSALEEAWLKGLDNCVCWVPKEVNSHFAKRLTQLGWTQDREGWVSWSRPTE